MSQGVLVAIVFAAAIVSRPLDAWLWRKGKLSDRTAAVLLIGRFPAMVALFLLIEGAGLVMVAVIALPVVIISRLFYGPIRDAMVDTRKGLEGQRRAKDIPRSN